MVDEELLQVLFSRTIYFLRQSATATSSLRIDMFILEGLQRDLFVHDPRTSSSFSSGASLHTPKMLMAAPPLMPHPSGEPGHMLSMSPHAHMGMTHGR